MNRHFFVTTFLAAAVTVSSPLSAQSVAGGSRSAQAKITTRIDQSQMVTLRGHVLKNLTPDRDLGAVEDQTPISLFLSLKRSTSQQADLDALIAAQQQPGSAEYHKWLTPQQFGERFGAAESDISQLTLWLQSQGFHVTGVHNNASIIGFTGTSGNVRNAFHAELHYWNVQGGRHMATATEPQIPAALVHVVAGISGLNQIPPHEHHTAIQQQAYDAETHTWHKVDAAAARNSPRARNLITPTAKATTI